MRKLYQQGKDNAGDARHKRRRRVLLGVLAAYSLAVIPVVRFWFSMTDEFTITSRMSGEVRTITKEQGYKTVDEPKYTVKLPADWTKDTVRSTASLAWFVSGSRTHQARTLEIYDGQVPAGFTPTRLAPIVPLAGGRIKPGPISDRCYTFTKPKEGFGNGLVSPPLPSSWQNVPFICNFSALLNIAATANRETGYLTDIRGPSYSGRYLFVYTDHTSSPDFGIFDTILRSFQHK